MNLLERLQKDLTESMKSKDSLRLGVLRGMKAALKNKEIENIRTLSESEELQVLRTLVKQRKDSIEQFAKGGRPDLVAKEEAELKILESYLPAAPDPAEVQRVIKETIAELQAISSRDMGRVMKAVMARFAGQNVDGKFVNECVRRELGG